MTVLQNLAFKAKTEQEPSPLLSRIESNKNIREDKKFCYLLNGSSDCRDGKQLEQRISYVFMLLLIGAVSRYLNKAIIFLLIKSIKTWTISIKLSKTFKSIASKSFRYCSRSIQSQQLLLAPHSPTAQDHSPKRIRTCKHEWVSIYRFNLHNYQNEHNDAALFWSALTLCSQKYSKTEYLVPTIPPKQAFSSHLIATCDNKKTLHRTRENELWLTAKCISRANYSDSKFVALKYFLRVFGFFGERK